MISAAACRPLALVSALLIGGCGGRVRTDDAQDDANITPPDTGVVAADTSTIVDSAPDTATVVDSDFAEDAPAVDAEPGCTFVDGTEMCGGAAKRCGDCAGSDVCVSLATAGGGSTAKDFGVCWPRYSAKTVIPSVHPCGACPAPDLLCVSVTSYPNLFCATKAACETLAARGHANSCWFADTTPWRSDASIPSIACPAGSGLCGGSCPPCSAGEVCTGRSPRHPLGVCARPIRTGTADVANRCRRDAPACPSGEACLIFSVAPDGDQKVADAYGMCLPIKNCSAAGASIPGGATCLDAKGTSV